MSSVDLLRSTPSDQAPRSPSVRIAGLIVAAIAVTNLLILLRGPIPWIGAVAGFCLAIPLPAWMISQKIDWKTDSPSERLGYSVVSAILGLMGIGLLINTVLPYLNIPRPLDREPVLIAVDLWCLAIACWRSDRFVPSIPWAKFERLKDFDWVILLSSALCVPLAILGANRLNNGAGNGVTFAMMCIAAVTFVALFAKRQALNPGTITAAIYFISLSMLLMTSLRGWYITGHDVQGEYNVFEITKLNGDWNIGVFQNAYNACLSLTILPTMLWQLLRVDDPYIFKFWFQLLFALCPVFVYRISVRYTSSALGIIATIYFISFPTFFTDMPFLNRQEMAYLFVAAIVLMATDPKVSHKTVRIKISILSVGIVFSHYSTAYVFLGTIGLAWATHRFITALRRRAASDTQRTRRRLRPMIPTVGFLNVSVMLIGIVLWNGLATHTAGAFGTALTQAIDSLRGGSDGSKSTVVSYSLFGGQGAGPPTKLLTDYTRNAISLTGTAAQRAAEGFYSAATLNKYPLTVVPLPNLPLTTLGKLLGNSGLNATTLNSIMRSGIARLLQLFVVIGLFSALRRAWKRPSGWMAELIALASGALIIVALQVVLPSISADYGVLRAFQQAMISFGPLIAVGSLAIFRFLPERWSLRATFAVAILFFASLVGIIPQAIGGYPAQLNLNNSGSYYDVYYTHPQDISAIRWLQAQVDSRPSGTPQRGIEIDPYLFQEVQTYTTLSMDPTDFPAELQKNAYWVLGYQTVTEHQASAFVNGDLITYIYPIKLLNSTTDLLYSSNGTLIYG